MFEPSVAVQRTVWLPSPKEVGGVTPDHYVLGIAKVADALGRAEQNYRSYARGALETERVERRGVLRDVERVVTQVAEAQRRAAGSEVCFERARAR